MAHKDSYTQLEQQYQRLGACLISTGIQQELPGVSGVGVADALGGYYPAPSWEQVHALLEKNQALVDRKTAQGFTNLLITPLAAPLPVLL
jgi:hypothetical protein